MSAPTPLLSAEPARDLRRLLPPIEIEQLDNGLTIAVMARPTPLVATALCYRSGARDDLPGCGGAAHFLEHMMFKGSRGYGAGEIDRLTRALGGSNNAFTSHDLTIYHFTFAADRWSRALDIERDRMAGLNLDPAEVASERQVIAEEIAMYESEPWDALDQAVATEFFSPHPYGRPVLGTRRELEAIDAGVLAEFHGRHYRPDNAVLVLAGGVGKGARERAAEIFADASPGRGPRRSSSPPAAPRSRLERLERRSGDLARMILQLPAPASVAQDHPRLRMLAAVLGHGRASRLQRALVDNGQLCVGVSVDLHDTREAGALSISLEVLPGVESKRVEAALIDELEALHTVPPSAEEVERARKILLADWIFDHERVHQQALFAASHLALFDAEYPWRYLENLAAVTPVEVAAVADSYLRPAAGSLIGWSLPADGETADGDLVEDELGARR